MSAFDPKRTLPPFQYSHLSRYDAYQSLVAACSGASSSRLLAERLRGRSLRARSSRRCQWGFLSPGSPDVFALEVAAFRKGLHEAGYVEGQNVTVEYHWLEGQYDRLPSLVTNLVRREVAVIATPANGPGAVAAKAATARIPIVFGIGQDPVRFGLVTSLARPGGNRPASIFSTRR